MFQVARCSAVALVVLSISPGCGGGSPKAAAPPCPAPAGAPVLADGSQPSGPATAAEAEAFIQQVSEQFAKLESDAERVSWVKSTFITDDTEQIESQAQERLMEFLARKIREARRFDGLQLAPDIARQFYVLQYSAELPAPADPKERAELAGIGTKLDGMYGKGKYCSPKLKGLGKDKSAECLPLEDLSAILATKRDYDLLLEAWRGWHTISPPMRPMYPRMGGLANKGAPEPGVREGSDIGTRADRKKPGRVA